ncbi:MAG: apolipoprotein N-acyltransferase [Clostridia bacterium]|nr:apolipoprotein N-acyltransferase [Clostridia bacterium]MBQ9804938.1 apolipoprotein N-acyltransferase [Clostridia bacterium]
MNTKKQQYILPYLLAGSFLTGLTLVFPKIGFLEWLTMIPLFIGVMRMGDAPNYRLAKAYWSGFLTVLCFYLVNYHWFTALYPLDFISMTPAESLVVVVAGWVGLSLLQAIPGGLIFLLFKLLHRTTLFRRVPLVRPFIFSALWIVFEWSSTLTWTGVPWGRLCLGQSEYLPILQSASLFGSYFVSFLLLAVNGLLAYAILSRTVMRRALICTSVALSLVIGNLMIGLFLQNIRPKPAQTLRVAVAQGNVNSHEKWGANSYRISRETYEDLTRKAADAGAELVVWPETAFPNNLNEDEDLQEFVSELARDCKVSLMVGALYTDEETGDGYNVLYFVTDDGVILEDTYAKRHLVPFGEYVPMQELIEIILPPLAELSALGNDLEAGTDTALFDTEWGKLGSLICFDSIYEMLTVDSVRDGAELMILSSNDSWFYDSAAIYQHEAQAKLRAIEVGRYMVRSGNTGISSIVTDKGEHLAWIDPLERGYAVADVETHTYRTLYSIIGNLFVYLCIGFVGGAFATELYWRKKRKQGEQDLTFTA